MLPLIVDQFCYVSFSFVTFLMTIYIFKCIQFFYIYHLSILLSFISHTFLGSNLGCGFIPGCEKCNDGLICKRCRQAFIPVEYERNTKKIIRCIRSCPTGYNITSRKGYPMICVRTQLGKLVEFK